jgi:hypothetical protein
MPDEISTLLDSYHSTTLWEMANEAGLEVTDRRNKRLNKAQVMAKMRAEFFTRERVLASLARLDERERAVLDRLLLHGGTCPTASLRRELLRARLVTTREEDKAHSRYSSDVPYAGGYAGDPYRERSTEFADVIARLTFRGLVFSADTSPTTGNVAYKLQFHPGGTLFVPEAVRRHLPEPEPLPVEMPDWQPEQVQPGDAALLLRDLYLYWDFVRRNEVPLLQSGLVGKRSLRAINSALLAPDPLLDNASREDETRWLYLLRVLLEALGLVRRQQGQLQSTAEDALHVSSFWYWPKPKQVQACLDAWLGLGPTSTEERQATQYGPRLSHARQALSAALQALPAGAWFDLDDLLELVEERDADFLFPEHTRIETYRSSYYYGHMGSYYYGSTKDLIARFERLERSFVETCVTGFLHSLGVVDVGQIGGRWFAFRLTPGGLALLGKKGKQAPPGTAAEETGRLVVQPSFQLLAIGPVSLGWLARLDLFADREQADRGAFVYNLSRESVYRAQQLGMDVDQVLHFLEEASGIDLPQNVRRSLEEWGAYHERIVFRTGVSLLQAADAGLLAELMADPQLGGSLARSLSPEVALLKKERDKPLIAGLVARGLFPAVSGVEPEAADGSVLIGDDGIVRPVHAVPGLHLQGRLARVAEEEDDGTWRLTAASVRRAGGSKNKVLHLLAELGRLHRGTLPARLVEQIKAWGSYYGSAVAGTLTLVEFRDQETLDELRTHPQLQELLTPFPAGSRALAVVPADRLAEVHEILNRLGVPVREGLVRQG